jgi:transposase
MTSMIAQSVGVDISKDTLDVHLHPAGATQRLANTPAGIGKLIAWLGDFTITRIVFEPTGAYHHALERRLGDAGLPLVKVNPRQARRFAEAIGCQAKTDAVDAAMLARYGALIEPPVRPMVSQALDEMKELHVARRSLVKDRVAIQNREHIRRSDLLKRQAAERLKQIDQQIDAIDDALRALRDADPALKTRFDILMSIPGVGEVTAFAIIVEIPELGVIENNAAASLAGLAPIARDSGRSRGKRFIRGGRADLRKALYMPALVAVRFNKPLKTKYQAFINAGKPPKVALIAIMRKLLILANALVRDGRTWTATIA